MTAYELAAILVQALGWSLVHFVWQAALVGVLYAATRALLPRGNPRYLAAMLALVAFAVMPAWTVWHEVEVLTQTVDLGDVVVASVDGPATAASAAPAGWLVSLGHALPWLVLVWAFGVMFLGVRVVRQWHGLRAIVRAAETLPVWQEQARRLGDRLGLRRAVRVLASVRIATPTLVGWVRPVVVMPLAMLARMPAEQVDLILAHELAHLRRLDHIANLFQVVLETLLFYHPVVHWISRDARNERELCCDALALRASGGRQRDFVAALAGLEEFRCDHADLALAASGGVLVERAWFITGAASARPHSRSGLMLPLFALLGAMVAAGVIWRQNVASERVSAVLADNAAVLRNGLAAAIGQLSMPVLRNASAQRQKLAPVPLAALAPVDAAKSPVVMASAGLPSLSIANLAMGSVHLDPIVRPSTAPVDVPPGFAMAAPHAVHAVAPVYPSQALLNGVQGLVEIQFSLDAAGMPQNLEVTRSSAAGVFDAAALSALSHWRFTPPADAGRRYRQTFAFRLGGAEAGDASVAQACLVRTGTHICRPVSETEPAIRTSQSIH